MIRNLVNILLIFCVTYCANVAAQNVNSGNIHKDTKNKFSFEYPSNYVLQSNSDNNFFLKEKKDMGQTVRIQFLILNINDSDNSGKTGLKTFAKNYTEKFVFKPADAKSAIDSISVKDFKCKGGFLSKESYAYIVFKDESGKESQMIKGPACFYDISSVSGVPGLVLLVYARTDDSKTSKVFRSVTESIDKFND